jgi:hypothetical protein
MSSSGLMSFPVEGIAMYWAMAVLEWRMTDGAQRSAVEQA